MDYIQFLSHPGLQPLIQLLLATLFGMILGIERVLAGRTAGPRTYGLVAMGACLLTIISLGVSPPYGEAGSTYPVQLVSAVVTGIGFLGAGLIIFRNSKLSGLTTAAGIWVAAAIGIAVGFRYFILSTFATFLTLFIFTVMWQVEAKIKHIFTEDNGNDE